MAKDLQSLLEEVDNAISKHKSRIESLRPLTTKPKYITDAKLEIAELEGKIQALSWMRQKIILVRAVCGRLEHGQGADMGEDRGGG